MERNARAQVREDAHELALRSASLLTLRVGGRVVALQLTPPEFSLPLWYSSSFLRQLLPVSTHELASQLTHTRGVTSATRDR